jgi:hypothetical protein
MLYTQTASCGSLHVEAGDCVIRDKSGSVVYGAGVRTAKRLQDRILTPATILFSRLQFSVEKQFPGTLGFRSREDRPTTS